MGRPEECTQQLAAARVMCVRHSQQLCVLCVRHGESLRCRALGILYSRRVLWDAVACSHGGDVSH